MKAKTLVLFVVFVSFLISPAFAHHGTAPYDLQHEVTVEGIVKDFQWTSPHSWLYVSVTDPNGAIEEWGGETGAPGMLSRRGWTSHMLKPGDRVKMSGHVAKDGAKVMLLTKIETADGKVIQ
jgi:hypothetical protein